MSRNSRLRLAAILGIFMGFGSGWCISGEIGWQRGDSYANWAAHYAAAQNRATMAQVGVCRWANLAADCKFK